jgi:prolyl-tRNA editing enzyme YbaK/EbsC (Cys-tRNA(Pro) deacylase)
MTPSIQSPSIQSPSIQSPSIQSPSNQRVIDALAAAGIESRIEQLATSTRTADEAAASVGTEVGQIVKSLVFLADGQPVMLLVSGKNMVDVAATSARLGHELGRANADQVREATGFAIGGVAPVGLATSMRIYMDPDLLAYDIVWAAAGTPHSVFAIDPASLQRAASATILKVTVD